MMRYPKTDCIAIQSGFTLIELLFGLALVSILAAIFGMGLVAAMQSYEFSRINTEIVQKGQPAMMRISRELKELTNITAITPPTTASNPYIRYERVMPVKNESGNDIQKTIPLAIHFNRLDNRIRLFIDPPDDFEANIDSGFVLIDNIHNLILNYNQYDSTDQWTASDDIALLSTIEVEIHFNRPDSANALILTTEVYPRNMRN